MTEDAQDVANVFERGRTVLPAHFAHRPLLCAVERKVVGSVTVLRVWFLIFLLVAFQTVTLMRPMLSPRGGSRNPQGKCFFLEHFRHSMFDAR